MLTKEMKELKRYGTQSVETRDESEIGNVWTAKEAELKYLQRYIELSNGGRTL